MYKLGIIGFGVVGKSVLAFLNRQKIDYSTSASTEHDLFDDPLDVGRIQVQIWDSRILGPAEQEIVKVYKATAVDASVISLKDFIEKNDFILASPGVDLSLYTEFSNKFLCELDFFSVFFTKPIIAVTGSLGKTTIVKVLGSLLAHVPSQALTLSRQCILKPVVGGNVGIGMLDLIQHEDACDLAIVELSSFQLERNKKFAPDIAVWTNWYPNHLDRHHTPEAYFDAKFNLVRFQQEHQRAILSDTLFTGQCGQWLNARLPEIASRLCICTAGPLTQEFIANIKRPSFEVFYVADGSVNRASLVEGKVSTVERIVATSDLPSVTFVQNWVQIVATLYHRGIEWKSLVSFLNESGDSLVPDHHHRLEYFSTVSGVDFYDDSKSTVVQSTLAAFDRLATRGRPIILIVGGLSKGVDRSTLAEQLKDHPQLKRMYCFGRDCAAFGSCDVCNNLEDTVHNVFESMTAGDIVLFSPSGTSFDFFKNYEQRGQVFKELVTKLGNQTMK
ncbi:MAG: UDP-N-acetylmuramoyl-L-alanine--D-glutamate ligase [Candidatus Babeliales bacterium]|jgi:UDP-N-acetylmuramoylalanine--D-glutamate ligase